jgi:hypothetical protein
MAINRYPKRPVAMAFTAEGWRVGYKPVLGWVPGAVCDRKVGRERKHPWVRMDVLTLRDYPVGLALSNSDQRIFMDFLR